MLVRFARRTAAAASPTPDQQDEQPPRRAARRARPSRGAAPHGARGPDGGLGDSRAQARRQQRSAGSRPATCAPPTPSATQDQHAKAHKVGPSGAARHGPSRPPAGPCRHEHEQNPRPTAVGRASFFSIVQEGVLLGTKDPARPGRPRAVPPARKDNRPLGRMGVGGRRGAGSKATRRSGRRDVY